MFSLYRLQYAVDIIHKNIAYRLNWKAVSSTVMADISKIGSRIRDVRLSRGMSQSALAEKANISLPHVSEIELGKSNMRLSTFIKVAEALQVSADDLIRLDVPNVHGLYQTEFASLLDGCSPGEIDSIIKIVKELKCTFQNHKENDV